MILYTYCFTLTITLKKRRLISTPLRQELDRISSYFFHVNQRLPALWTHVIWPLSLLRNMRRDLSAETLCRWKED